MMLDLIKWLVRFRIEIKALFAILLNYYTKNLN